MMENIENDNKTLSISNKTEIENYIKGKTRLEMEIPFGAIEDALKIFDAIDANPAESIPPLKQNAKGTSDRRRNLTLSFNK